MQEFSAPHGPFLAVPRQEWTYDKTANVTDISPYTFSIKEPENEDPTAVVGRIESFSGRFLLREWVRAKGRGKLLDLSEKLWIVRSGP